MKVWGQQSTWKDWELSVAAEIWLQVPPFLDMRKNWVLDWTSVGAVIFVFVPKTRFLGRVLGTLGDALRPRGLFSNPFNHTQSPGRKVIIISQGFSSYPSFLCVP